MDNANDEQNKLTQNIREFKSNNIPRNPSIIKEKSDVINKAMALLRGREMVYNGFESATFPLKNQSIMLA